MRPDRDDELLEPGIEGPERESLLALARRLDDERPLPDPSFRGDLSRRLELREDHARDLPRLRRLALSCGLSGAALLGIATLGLAGVGPLVAG
jgi:hypothetical protein